MAKILTKGVKLSYADTAESSYTILTNLYEVPELGNGAREKIEVTTLDDDVKKYIAGLGDAGQDLTFGFRYDDEDDQFMTLNALTDTHKWKVTFPSGMTATFDGTPSVSTAGMGTNANIDYTLTITVESAIAFAKA